MERGVKTGFSFGLVSGIITTLGLMIGLNAATSSRLVLIGGILTIALADSFSDALGIHISEEFKKRKNKEVWSATFSTLISKFIFAMTFVIPILVFNLTTAIIISIIWGLILISVLSYYIAKKGNKSRVIIEHLTIAIIVIVLTNFVGKWISNVFI